MPGVISPINLSTFTKQVWLKLFSKLKKQFGVGVEYVPGIFPLQKTFKISKYFCAISPASSILSISSFINIQPIDFYYYPFLLYIPWCLLCTSTINVLLHSLHALDMGASYKSLIVFACFFKSCYCEVSEKGQGDYLVGKIESAGTLLLSSKKSDLFMT